MTFEIDRIACAIMLYNRPRYTAYVLDSLAKNKHAERVDWWIFVDGPRSEADRGKVKNVFNLAKNFPHERKMIQFETENQGVPIQKAKAHQLFERGYSQIIFFEDDMIVSPYYLNLMMSLQRQFPYYLVHAPARPIRDGRLPIPEDAELDHVKELHEHLWGYSITKYAYDKIADGYDEYVRFFVQNNIDYLKRPHDIIKRRFGIRVSSHDAMLDKLFEANRIYKIATVIPRGKYIGEYGIHQGPHMYKEQGYHWLPYYTGEFDAATNVFRFYHGNAIGEEV